MTIKNFAKVYSRTYDVLYDSQIPYNLAVEGFDNMVKTDKKFLKKVRELCNFTHDIISSDREAAAFFLAYGAILEEENIKKLNAVWARA